MSPPAVYPTPRRSVVAPVGDACRPVKPLSRFPEIVLTNSRVSVVPESSAKSSPWGPAPLGSVVAPPTARGAGEIPQSANPMSPSAGYPVPRRSWVTPVGDACRLVKLRSRLPEIVLTNSRVSVVPESSAKSSPWGPLPLGAFPRPPRRVDLGKSPKGGNPMSPSARYPAARRSWVAPVGDACRLVKLRFRFPGMIFKDSQAARGAGILCGEFAVGGRSRWGALERPPTAPGVSIPPPSTRPSIQTDRGSRHGAGYPDRRGQHLDVCLDTRLISTSHKEYFQ